MRSIVDPRMLGRITPAFYTRLCTVDRNVPTTDAGGQQVPGFVGDPALAHIPCSVTVQSADETYTGYNVEVLHYIIELSGRFDGIRISDRATVDGVVYDIRGVMTATHAPNTRLVCRRVV